MLIIMEGQFIYFTLCHLFQLHSIGVLGIASSVVTVLNFSFLVSFGLVLGKNEQFLFRFPTVAGWSVQAPRDALWLLLK